MALSASCNAPLALRNKSIIVRPFSTFRPAKRISQHVAHSMVSKDSLPEQYRDESKFKLHFVCFSRLAPDQTTAQCEFRVSTPDRSLISTYVEFATYQLLDKCIQDGLPEHLKWLQSIDQAGQLAFHGNFLNPEATNYGSGMYALICDSTSDAKALAEQDPLHARGIRRFEMLPWVQQTTW